jgi:hypothetical protein
MGRVASSQLPIQIGINNNASNNRCIDPFCLPAYVAQMATLEHVQNQKWLDFGQLNSQTLH